MQKLFRKRCKFHISASIILTLQFVHRMWLLCATAQFSPHLLLPSHLHELPQQEVSHCTGGYPVPSMLWKLQVDPGEEMGLLSLTKPIMAFNKYSSSFLVSAYPKQLIEDRMHIILILIYFFHKYSLSTYYVPYTV